VKKMLLESVKGINEKSLENQTLSLNNINPKMIAVGEGFEPPRSS